MQEPPGGQPIDIPTQVGVLHQVVVSTLAVLLRSEKLTQQEFAEIFARAQRGYTMLGVPRNDSAWQDQIGDLLASVQNGAQKEADAASPAHGRQ